MTDTVQIGEAVIVLTSSLKLTKLRLLQSSKIGSPYDARKADRAEVVERDRFATPNPLKSHGERNLLSPVSNTCAITPKLRGQYTLRKITRHSNHVPQQNLHSARGTVGAPLPAISCFGAFWTPAARARGECRHPGVQKPAHNRTHAAQQTASTQPLRLR